MSFDYDEIKSKEDGGSHWATYSDLFMVLSIVFLLLYVVASVRNGTSNIKSNSEYMAVARERDALKEEIKAYNTLKDNYLETVDQKEQKNYQELMKKLSLLKEEAKKEKEDLLQASRENAKKEMALNKYQRMIRNIINSNMLASANLERRSQTIKKRNKTIDEQKGEIKNLEQTVAQKKKQIKRGKAKIKNLNANLSKSMKKLKQSFKQRKITKKKMQAKMKALQAKNEKKVQQLRKENRQASQEIAKNQQKIQQVNRQLAQAEQTIASQQSSLEELQNQQQQTFEKMSKMQGEFERQQQREKMEFQRQLSQQKLSAEAKAAKQREFLAKAREQQQAMAREINKMENQINGVQSQLDKTRQAQAQAEAQSKALASKNKNLSADLKRMKEIADAKKKLVADMKKNLAKAGLKAKVGKSGDVIIEFGEEYFDTGKASMKPGMEKILKKFMPAYSKSLFSDPKKADKIKSVEIVGYASPTYKGRYVDPDSLDAQDKEAVNYNLSLSFNRAKSIFGYIFDQDKMRYKHQRKIRSMTKVTGRSFLAEGAKNRDVANMRTKEYCKKYDCKKSQRVVIKFNMKN